jgi:hypothetical protein
MIAVAELVGMVERLDCTLTLQGEALKVRGPKPLPAEVIVELRNRKSELIQFLGDLNGVSDEWRKGAAQIQEMAPVRDWPPPAWDRLRAALPAFMRTWAPRAARLGWSSAELFAAHQVAPYARLDCQGLAVSLHQCSVHSLSERDAIVTLTGSASRLNHRRGRPATSSESAVPIWMCRPAD